MAPGSEQGVSDAVTHPADTAHPGKNMSNCNTQTNEILRLGKSLPLNSFYSFNFVQTFSFMISSVYEGQTTARTQECTGTC